MKTLNRDCKQHRTPTGSNMRPVYVLDPVEKTPVIDHYEDFQAIIQSYADDVAINRIMERHALGDISVTEARSGINDISKKGDLDLTFLKDVKDTESLERLQAQYLQALYNNYQGDKSIMTPDKFVEAIIKGDYKSLNIIPKEENSNA